MIMSKRLNIEEIRELYNDYYFKKGMEANINHILFNMNYEYKFELDADSEDSYSSDNLIHIGLPNECIGMTKEKIYAIVKALVGHETAHIKWSNFGARAEAIRNYRKEGGDYLLFSSIHNILEDGRVERLLCEELKGYRKYIKFLQKELIIKKYNANLQDEGTLINLVKTIHYLSVIGKYPSNYKKLFSESQREIIEKEIEPKVIESVNSNSYKIPLEMTKEIINIMSSMIDKDMNEREKDFLRELSTQTYNSSNGKDEGNKKSCSSLLTSQKNNQENKESNNQTSDFKNEDSINKEHKESGSNNSTNEKNPSTSLDSNNNKNNTNDNEIKTQEFNSENSDSKENKDSRNKEDNTTNENNESKDNNDSGDNNFNKNSDTSNVASMDNNFENSQNEQSNDSNNNCSKNEENANPTTDTESCSISDNFNQKSNTYSQKNTIPANHLGSEDYDKSFANSKILDEKMFRELDDLIDSESQKALNTIKLKSSKNAQKERELNKSKEKMEDYHSEIDLDSINKNYSSKTKEVNFKYEYPNIPYGVAPMELNMEIRKLENEFKKLLNYRQTTTRNQKKGRLDSSKLWKLSMHDGNVFYKKNNNNNGDCAVYILIDMSGSTSGIKYQLEMSTAICIEQALMNIPNVEVKTVGFNHDYSYTNRYDKTGYTRMRVFKDFKEKTSKTPSAYKNSYSGGDNRDGFAIRVALDDLSKHPAKNKLLLILSDGMPLWNGESREEAMADVKKAVHEGRKSTTIMSILLNEGEIDKKTQECFNYMYEDRGNISVDITKEPENIMKYLSLYLRRVLKRR